MFYAFLKFFFPHWADQTPLHLFSYTSVRAGCALGAAFFLSLLLGPMCISWLKKLKMGQQVRMFKTTETQQFNIHNHKAGTTTMGGILIIATTLISAVLFCDPYNSYVGIVAIVMLGAGLLGFMDDYLKVAKHNHKGVSPRMKLAGQATLGLIVGIFIYKFGHSEYLGSYRYPTPGIKDNGSILIPFFKDAYPTLGALFILWVVIVITATSNAVNLTDGLDGLAISTTIFVALPYMVITYLASRYDYASYLYIPHIPQAGELVVFQAALLGASLGFLWFNSHPAQVFMGDTGSLSLGAVLGTIALLCKHELLLVLIGGIFVVEALSVVLQVGSFKLRGKRIFLMSPLHNHFVKLGMSESKIITRFMIVAILLALVGLSTLKLR